MDTINLRPAHRSLDAAALDDLITLYLDAMRTKLEPHTLIGYAHRLAYFRRWWANAGPHQNWQLSRADFVQFEYWLRSQTTCHKQPMAYHSRRDAVRRLRQVFRWAYRHDYIPERDYSLWIPMPDGGPVRRKAPSLEHLRALFDAAQHSPYPRRDQAILAFLIGTGVRRGEVASLTIERIHIYVDYSGTADVIGKRTRANPTGQRSVAFDAATGKYLCAFLEQEDRDSGAMWLGPRGPLSTQSIHRVVKRCIEIAGLEDVLQASHDLRRGFATHFSRAFRGEGYSDVLRRQMGHASYGMTTEYVLLDVEDIRSTLVSPMTYVVAHP